MALLKNAEPEEKSNAEAHGRPSVHYPDAEFRRQRLRLFLLIFFAYIGYYFCRVTLPVTLPLLQREFGFTATQTGFILSAYYATYAVAKAVNGFLGDRIGGKAMMLVGIFGSVACNVVFGFGRELYFFAVIWGLNAYFQSMGWLGLVPVMSRWYKPAETGRAMGFMSLSYQIGDLVARSSAGFFLVLVAWPALFWAHGAILGAIGLLVLAALAPAPPVTKNESVQRGVAQSVSSPQHRRAWRRAMLASRAFWVVCAVYLGLSMVRYIFWGWSVDYLMQSGSGIGRAVLTSAVFPLAGSLGTLFAGWMSDRGDARRGPIIVVMSFLLAAAVYSFSMASTDQPYLMVLCFGLMGFALYGPYSLMAGAIAIDFGSEHSSATAAGLIDAVGAAGVIVTGIGMGFLIDRYGWQDSLSIVFGIALATAILSVSLWNLRPRPLKMEDVAAN